MAIKTETVEVRYCDCCGRKSDMPLTSCPVCGRENCYTCSSRLYDVWHTNICKKCLENENINAELMSGWEHWGKEREAVIAEMAKQFSGHRE